MTAHTYVPASTRMQQLEAKAATAEGLTRMEASTLARLRRQAPPPTVPAGAPPARPARPRPRPPVAGRGIEDLTQSLQAPGAAAAALRDPELQRHPKLLKGLENLIADLSISTTNDRTA